LVMHQLGYHSTPNHLMQHFISLSDIRFVNHKVGFNASGACLGR
jgi:hypothetical protein